MKFGLLGVSVENSLSPALHRFFGSYEYELCSVSRDMFYKIMSEKRFLGVNVTMPYKTDAYELCDDLSETALRVGCVNTVINRGGRLYGCNTDYFGMDYMLQRAGIALCGKRIAILGGGGTYRTARALCENESAKEIFHVSRHKDISYHELHRLPAEVLINTTPVGMSPDLYGCPADISRMENLSAVADVIYTPLRTELVQQAQESGMKTASGLIMLAAQAKASAELFTGENIDDSLIERAYADVFCRNANIVLIGMAGCGKTSVGRILADMLSRPFYDTDEIVEKTEKMTIPELFQKFGESGFREKERKAVESITGVTGSIISAGGGTVMDESNLRNLRRNGRLVNIIRNPAQLATEGRPLSKSREEAEKLFITRQPVYESCSEISILNSATLQDAADRILKELSMI